MRGLLAQYQHSDATQGTRTKGVSLVLSCLPMMERFGLGSQLGALKQSFLSDFPWCHDANA
ncbi:unnamed protein product, partial [Timema podura]|nr:unnamed protein product [Timema podura]